jgi:hypothetical protein
MVPYLIKVEIRVLEEQIQLDHRELLALKNLKILKLHLYQTMLMVKRKSSWVTLLNCLEKTHNIS